MSREGTGWQMARVVAMPFELGRRQRAENDPGPLFQMEGSQSTANCWADKAGKLCWPKTILPRPGGPGRMDQWDAAHRLWWVLQRPYQHSGKLRIKPWGKSAFGDCQMNGPLLAMNISLLLWSLLISSETFAPNVGWVLQKPSSWWKHGLFLSTEVTFSCFPEWEGSFVSSFPAEEVPEAPGLWKWGERPSWASRRTHQLGELSDWAKGMRRQWGDHEGRGSAQHGFWVIKSHEDNFFDFFIVSMCRDMEYVFCLVAFGGKRWCWDLIAPTTPSTWNSKKALDLITKHHHTRFTLYIPTAKSHCHLGISPCKQSSTLSSNFSHLLFFSPD